MHKQAHLPAAFAELGLEIPILRALHKAGFVDPSEIQKAMIPVVLAGKDVLGQARTGTGKTAAFGLPILQGISVEKGLQSLVVVPTRELAVQVAAEIRRLADSTGLHIVPIYGGQKIKHQLHLLGKKPHIVVGTPGRILDLLDRRELHFNDVRIAVLDEVDRMLDIGFRDDIRRILSRIEHEHQTVFVSATLTDEIKRLAKQYMRDPIEINVSQDDLTVDHVHQVYMTVDPWDKFALLKKIMETESPQLVIVFCNTKHAARKLAKRLHDAGVNAKEIHGDLVQQKRERVMERFRKHNIHVLVATDLAARGIDVNGITHIVNYDTPPDPHVYVHRIGRTARMGSFGKAITFVTREEGKQLTEIERLINKEIAPEQVEGFAARSAPEESRRDQAVAVPAKSRYTTSVFSEGLSEAPAAEAVPSRPKSLGAKFKPARKRRR